MTKTVRIENADMSAHKVRVYAEFRQEDGSWARITLAPEAALDNPTDLYSGTIYASRRLVIEEVE